VAKDWNTYTPKGKPSAAKFTMFVGFAVTPESAEDIRRCVMRRGVSLSAWMRNAAEIMVQVEDDEFYETGRVD